MLCKSEYSKWRFKISQKLPIYLPQTHAYGIEFNFVKLKTKLRVPQLQCYYPYPSISVAKLHTVLFSYVLPASSGERSGGLRSLLVQCRIQFQKIIKIGLVIFEI